MRTKKIFSASLLLISLGVHSSEEIIKRKNYTLNYNEDHEVANWVSYELDHKKLQNCTKRNDNFRPDPLVSTGSAVDNDYKGSGFDRGHLLPAGDMKHNKEAMSDTFYFSNMTPQPANFNRGVWAKLENMMRSWGLKYGKIWIITGPLLRDNLAFIGSRNHVSVPEQYFKVILREQDNSYEGIGFLMSTSVPSNNLQDYATSIDAIEELTGFDFFEFLEDSTEEEVEGNPSLMNWDMSGKFQYLPCQS